MKQSILKHLRLGIKLSILLLVVVITILSSHTPPEKPSQVDAATCWGYIGNYGSCTVKEVDHSDRWDKYGNDCNHGVWHSATISSISIFSNGYNWDYPSSLPDEGMCWDGVGYDWNNTCPEPRCD